jgi:uncharacterized protein (DUF1697 family)
MPSPAGRGVASRVAVLLRGINVGGRHVVPMAAVQELFAGLGCRDVATYIQSGNLVCTAPDEFTEAAAAKALTERFGFAIPVALRTRAEMDAVVRAHPAFGEGLVADAWLPAHRHVVFLERPLDTAAFVALASKGIGSERVLGAGRGLLLYLRPAWPGIRQGGTGERACDCRLCWRGDCPTCIRPGVFIATSSYRVVRLLYSCECS